MPSPHADSPEVSRSTPSSSAVRCQGLGGGSAGAGGGAVSRRKRSTAATKAAAPAGDALGATISSFGRRLGTGPRRVLSPVVPELPVLDRDAIYAAVSPEEAIESVREAFLRHHRGEWTMPAKVYLDSPPHGDFRAMPALGGELAMLKWISSFPGNPRERGLPAVIGVICLSDARTSEPVAL